MEVTSMISNIHGVLMVTKHTMVINGSNRWSKSPTINPTQQSPNTGRLVIPEHTKYALPRTVSILTASSKVNDKIFSSSLSLSFQSCVAIQGTALLTFVT